MNDRAARQRRARNHQADPGQNTIIKDHKAKNSPARTATILVKKAQPRVTQPSRTKTRNRLAKRVRPRVLRIPTVIRRKHLVPKALRLGRPLLIAMRRRLREPKALRQVPLLLTVI